MIQILSGSLAGINTESAFSPFMCDWDRHFDPDQHKNKATTRSAPAATVLVAVPLLLLQEMSVLSFSPQNEYQMS